MNKLFIFIFLLFSAFIFNACDSCTSCKVVQEINGQTFETPFDEFCGSESELENFEASLMEGLPEDGNLECIRLN